MNIIFWLNHPPVACKGVFDAVGAMWGDKCYYVCENGFDKNRALLNVKTNSDSNNIEYIFLKDDNEADSFIKRNKNEYFVFNGYRGKMEKRIDFLRKCNKKALICIWAERPTKLMSWLNVLHWFYAIKYRNKVVAFLPLGDLAVKKYIKLGWKQEKIFPFFYAPTMEESLTPNKTVGLPVKFLFIGRFKKQFKGLGTLMDAFDLCEDLDYSLDMAGGYGDDREEVLSWISKSEKRNFIGTIPLNNVCSVINKYDVCVVPSENEGWNVVTNQAIMACVGCIISDQAVSDELVKAANCGFVFQAGNANDLAKKIQKVLNEKQTILSWKESAYAFKNRLYASNLAKYFMDIVNFSCELSSRRPKRPW